MKRAIVLALLVLPVVAAAQSRPFETINDARQRQGAERYDVYRDRGYQAPLGGYQDRLGDPAPRGTLSPGYEPMPTSPRYPSPSVDHRSPGATTIDSAPRRRW